MSTPTKGHGSPNNAPDSSTATFASFSPPDASPTSQRRSTVLMQQKSPLLIATPPQVTRALAFSHPFILPLNKFMGLVTWSSGDPWESFLVVAGFWAVVLYGDYVLRWSGPVLMVTGLIAAMYLRRYSPLSSTSWTGEKVKGHNREESEGGVRHQKSLDEILNTLNVFTLRCNILLEPFLRLTDFLSTQRTATSATTRPALTTLLIRILMITPLWIALTLPPLYVVTSRRVIMITGTLILSWHSRPARVSRTILWRSLTVRYLIAAVTGLRLGSSPPPQGSSPPPLPPRKPSQHDLASSLASHEGKSTSGVRFTFAVYENQRRWLGLGWTSSMFAYERAAWTDEHLNPSSAKENFILPVVEGASARWRWVPGSGWRAEGAGKAGATDGPKPGEEGWIYYDNKWNNGRRYDGWGRYTRRRKWYRDAELIENGPDEGNNTPTELPASEHTGRESETASSHLSHPDAGEPLGAGTDNDDTSSHRRRGFFKRNRSPSGQSSTHSSKALAGSDEDRDSASLSEPPGAEARWGVDDDVRMGLG